MSISKRATEITDGIYIAYGSNSGWLFGIAPEHKEAVKGLVQVTLDKIATVCPFCGDDGFDTIGLKWHLTNYCDPYKETDNP